MKIEITFTQPEIQVSVRKLIGMEAWHVCIGYHSGERYQHSARRLQSGLGIVTFLVEDCHTSEWLFLGEVKLHEENVNFSGYSCFHQRDKDADHFILCKLNTDESTFQYEKNYIPRK